ncbi:MAG: hypothetical protein KDA27_03650 [Candidatus Eisenbacteria bacterium]|uniref:Uncharacterized protein n=1 Tax=Eiseniibacteriota bacterium TaxID=2212470 RepID=A0A956N9W2_UNCEI|nr:hypothetical protein [Candidatus Eisenbacteria bacterium]
MSLVCAKLGLLSLVSAVVLVAWPGWARAYEPFVDLSSLLDQRYYPATGGYFFGEQPIYLVFPPEGDANIELVFSKDGTEISRTPLRLEGYDGFPAFARLASPAPPVQGKGPGRYDISIWSDGKQIGALEYELAAESGGDPFAPKTSHSRKGPWEELAYVYVPPTETANRYVSVHLWTSLAEVGATRSANASVRLRRGETLVAESRSFVISSEDWAHGSAQLDKAGTDHKEPLRPSDLTGRDGAYLVEYQVEGRTVRTFSLQVSGGEIVASVRSGLDHSPPSDRLTPRKLHFTGSSAPIGIGELFWMQRMN